MPSRQVTATASERVIMHELRGVTLRLALQTAAQPSGEARPLAQMRCAPACSMSQMHIIRSGSAVLNRKHSLTGVIETKYQSCMYTKQIC